MMLKGFRVQWLYDCYYKWTSSTVQTPAWNYRNDFDGFVRWFLLDSEFAKLRKALLKEGI